MKAVRYFTAVLQKCCNIYDCKICGRQCSGIIWFNKTKGQVLPDLFM